MLQQTLSVMYYKTDNSIIQYLVGERAKDGEFWCWAEFANKDKALVYYNDCLQHHPKDHIQLVEKVVSYNIIRESFPSK